jgi:hypothetical protein
MSEFLFTKAKTSGQGISQQLVTEAFLQLVEKEVAYAVEDKLRALQKKETLTASNILHAFENVLLRYESAKDWRTFLLALFKRKKWWEKSELGSNAPGWAKLLWKWIASDPDNWLEGHPAFDILRRAHVNLKEAFYGKKRTGYKNPPLSDAQFDAFMADLIPRLREATLREYLCRWIGGALYG